MLVLGDPPPVPGHVEGRVPAHDILSAVYNLPT